MSYCRYCGKPLNENEICECQKNKKKELKDLSFNEISPIINKIKDKIITSISNGNLSFYERGKQIVPDCIQPDQGEIPIKQYNIARLRSVLKGMNAEGRLQITNKRLIFRATGASLLGKTVLQHEFDISELAGIEIRKDHRISILNFIVFIFIWFIISGITKDVFNVLANVSYTIAFLCVIGLAVATILLQFTLKGMYLIKYLLLSIACGGMMVVGTERLAYVLLVPANALYGLLDVALIAMMILNLLVISFVPNLVICIKTKGGSAPIEIRRRELHFFTKMADQQYTGFSDVMPWEDTYTAINEIGAIINDINTIGDDAIEKWKENGGKE